jgi:hypothetical protein
MRIDQPPKMQIQSGAIASSASGATAEFMAKNWLKWNKFALIWKRNPNLGYLWPTLQSVQEIVQLGGGNGGKCFTGHSFKLSCPRKCFNLSTKIFKMLKAFLNGNSLKKLPYFGIGGQISKILKCFLIISNPCIKNIPIIFGIFAHFFYNA